MTKQNGRKTRNERGRSRPTIGLINDTVIDPNSGIIWSGVSAAAEKNDVNLICFPASTWRSAHGFDAQANILFDLVRPERIDALVFWGSLIRFTATAEEEVRDFIRRYTPLPMASIAIPLEGVPTVILDGFRGMFEAVSHLIEVHGCRRIAFVRGPEMHPEAEDRFRAYRESLQGHKIPFDPQLVAPGDFKKPSGRNAVQLLHCERRVAFDALVAANDIMAIDAMEALRAAGVQVPSDVAVVGFDDIAEGRQITPPLTTVKQSFYEQAQHATHMVLEMLAEKKSVADVSLPTRVVIRQSCGCLDPLVTNAAADSVAAVSTALPVAIAKSRKRLVAEMAQVERPLENQSELAARLVDAFLDDMQKPGEADFLPALFQILQQSALAGADISSWHDALSTLRRYALPALGDLAVQVRAENLFQQARVMIGETARQTTGHQMLQAEEEARILNEISQALITIFDQEELLKAIAQELPKLGISRCYLSLYEDRHDPVQWSRLMLAYDKKGQREIPKDGIRFPSRHLVPDGFLDETNRFSIVVEPLYFREEQIGFVLFDAVPEKGPTYDVLRAQLSSALKGEALVKGIEQRSLELAESNAQLTKAYADLKENQEKLLISEKMASLGRLTAGIAHEMNTPLAAVRAAIKELSLLVDEYQKSVGNPEVLAEDHQAIAADMMKNLHIANQAAEKSAGFIRGIKAQTIDLVSKPQQTFPAAAVVRDILNLLEFALKRGQCKLVSDLDDTVELHGDPRSLAQIVTNLVTNSVEACAPQGGTITVSLKKADEASAVLEVVDSGCGIPAENLSRIFDPLFTTKPFGKGTGLGLSIVHDLVNEFKGTIQAASRPGATTFTITLPSERRNREHA